MQSCISGYARQAKETFEPKKLIKITQYQNHFLVANEHRSNIEKDINIY